MERCGNIILSQDACDVDDWLEYKWQRGEVTCAFTQVENVLKLSDLATI